MTIIVSNNFCNDYGSRVVVLPLTSNVESLYPGEALVTVKGKRSRALGDQIRSLDKSQLRSRREALSHVEMTRSMRQYGSRSTCGRKTLSALVVADEV
ncbi:MAG: type II toxin-antitoxin system PemK/MazF family toxin [Nitrospira sp.]|nr:type II toxin-antitoxin system PemK/MazF family toxin [Nitrospira sp.]